MFGVLSLAYYGLDRFDEAERLFMFKTDKSHARHINQKYAD